MAKARARVMGLPELGRAMKLLGEEVATKISRGMAYAGTKLVQKDAIQNAPMSDAVHRHGRSDEVVAPGNLRRNIIVKKLPPGETKLTHEYIVAVRHGRGPAHKDAFYWRFVEFGTVNMPEQPFLEPALAKNRAKATDEMRRYGQSRVEAAARKAARAAGSNRRSR